MTGPGGGTQAISRYCPAAALNSAPCDPNLIPNKPGAAGAIGVDDLPRVVLARLMSGLGMAGNVDIDMRQDAIQRLHGPAAAGGVQRGAAAYPAKRASTSGRSGSKFGISE